MFGNPTQSNKNYEKFAKFGINEAKLLDYGFVDEKSYFFWKFDVHGKEFRNYIFPVNEEYVKKYNKNLMDEWNLKLSTIKHFALALGVTEDLFDKAFKKPKNSYSEWSKTVIKLIKYVEKENKKSVFDNVYDVFLEWQPKIAEGYNKAFLQLPYSVKFGDFISEHIEPVGYWKMVKTDRGIIFVDKDENVHPFKRGSWYAKSKFANRLINESGNNNPFGNVSNVDTDDDEPDFLSDISNDVDESEEEPPF